MVNQALLQIYNRQKSLSGSKYIEIFSVDDTKKNKNSIKMEHIDLDKIDCQTLHEKTESLNFGSQGVFINLNPLKAPKRNKDNIKNIQYVFIDLDDAQKDHNEIIIQALNKLHIKYSYNAESGSGFHFLIPVNLETKDESLIKGFLKYLKVNFCDKVDLATADTPRLLRVPESLHNKKGEFRLKTLYCSNGTDFKNNDIIDNNSLLVSKFQAEISLKGNLDNIYIDSVVKEDIFFSTIFSTSDNRISAQVILSSAGNRNGVFIKNLAIFLYKHPDYASIVKEFLLGWEASRVSDTERWITKATENKWEINYKELLIWAKENDIEYWIKLLKNQLKTSFLDNGLSLVYSKSIDFKKFSLGRLDLHNLLI